MVMTNDNYLRACIKRQVLNLQHQINKPDAPSDYLLKLNWHLGDAISGQFTSFSYEDYLVSVDYDIGINELIKMGHYGIEGYIDSGVDKRIREWQPPATHNGKIKTIVTLIQFKGNVFHDFILRELNRTGYYAAGIYKLLALGAEYPDIQRKTTIVAPGSTYEDKNGTYWPYLSENELMIRYVGLS